MRTRTSQEASLIFACSNIDYLRAGNVKSLTLCDQETLQTEGKYGIVDPRFDNVKSRTQSLKRTKSGKSTKLERGE